MIWRKIRKADLPALFSLHPAVMGHEFAGLQAASEAWDRLFDLPGFVGVVIEHSKGVSTRIVGFGMSVFVSDRFAYEHLGRLQPGLNARIVSEVIARSNAVLTKSQIAEDNSSAGLNSAILGGRWINEDLSAEEIAEVQLHLAASFVETHAGYRLKRMLTELTDPQDLAFARASRLWRIIPYATEAGITAIAPPFDAHRALGLIETEDVRALAGSILAPLFLARTPRLCLRITDQELLAAALRGATDVELAEELRISLPAVKRRWEDIYERVKSCQFDLGLRLSVRTDEGKRGPQKRHRLLAYLREHPEELRPFINRCNVSHRN